MGVFLADVSQRHPHEFILMVLDGAGGPRAERLQAQADLKLISLPASSPQLTPVEHLWDEVWEKWFGKRVFAGMSDREAQLLAALTILEDDPQPVSSLAGFDWIRSIPLNAN